MVFPPVPLLRGSAGFGLPAPAGDTGAGAAASRAGAALAPGTFDELVARHRDRVFRVALSVLGPGSEADAEDVAQETFIRLHRSLGRSGGRSGGRARFRGESRVGTWLYRVAFNLAVDLHRSRARRGTAAGEETLATLPAEDGDPHRSARQGERTRRMARLLATLPESHRAALHLHYWMGHSVAEIAELLGVAPGTVKAHLHRGRERLRTAMTTADPETTPEETP
jgi:RNA polymerase sigma-70 factor (ECF subfamily)